MYVYMYICTYVHMYICIYVYMYICISCTFDTAQIANNPGEPSADLTSSVVSRRNLHLTIAIETLRTRDRRIS